MADRLYRNVFASLLVVCGLGLVSLAGAQPLVSGKPIKVGVNGGVGLLAAPNTYSCVPLGHAKVFDGKRPDFFLAATRGLEPGVFLYGYLRQNDRNQPVFAPPVPVKLPFTGREPPDGTIFQTSDGTIHGCFFAGGKLTHCVMDVKEKAFREVASLALKGAPRGLGRFTVTRHDDTQIDLVFSASNGAKGPTGDTNSDDFAHYDGTGAYRGQWPYAGLVGVSVKPDLSGLVGEPRQLTRSLQEVRGYASPTGVALGSAGGNAGVISGGRYGNFYYFSLDPGSATDGERKILVNTQGNVIRHPTVGASPIAYPSTSGQATDLLVGGEGAVYYYRFSGKFDPQGRPMYDDAEPVWQEDADLYTGSLPVPSAADWDGDGNTDLIVGNSEGRILFHKNHGSDREPEFGIGEPMRAGGNVIEIQQGYRSVQGPGEARWGYSCPTVADWNEDGLPDLLISSARPEHWIAMNVGTKTEPKLSEPRPIYLDGLDLHGQWRTRPAVAKMGRRMAYITQDDAGALRRYWRIDDTNVEDAGPLTLTTGASITVHITPGAGPGQKGRPKLELVDWDGDGALDLFVGTAKRGSLPEPERGLPWLRRKGSGPGVINLQVVYLRNAGTNEAPAFEYPRQLQFRGKDIYLGAHANSPEACTFGEMGKLPNLLIGMESGRIYFFHHDDVTFYEPPPEARD